MSVLNSRRLRDYPRLMFITIWAILCFSILFKQGWLSAFRQIIGTDFVTLYSSGLIYRTDISHLYDLPTQAAVQQTLIAPTQLAGVNPFISPPYVAAFYSLFTFIKLPLAFILWTVLTIAITAIAVRGLIRLIPGSISASFNSWQLMVIVLSFFPFVEGLQAGQNHALTLLLVSLIVILTLEERWFPAGLMAGFLIYKPQMIVGLILIWLIWRKYKALAGMATIAITWAGSVLVLNGLFPFVSYLRASQEFLLLPYTQGFPAYLLLTFNGLLATIFPVQFFPGINSASLALSIILFIMLAWLAFKSRSLPMLERAPVLVLALLLPLVATPYALFHDLVILIPAFILWTRYDSSRRLLLAAIMVYLASFFLPLIASTTKIALMSIITIGLTVAILTWTFTQKKNLFWEFH